MHTIGCRSQHYDELPTQDDNIIFIHLYSTIIVVLVDQKPIFHLSREHVVSLSNTVHIAMDPCCCHAAHQSEAPSPSAICHLPYARGSSQPPLRYGTISNSLRKFYLGVLVNNPYRDPLSSTSRENCLFAGFSLDSALQCTYVGRCPQHYLSNLSSNGFNNACYPYPTQ